MTLGMFFSLSARTHAHTQYGDFARYTRLWYVVTKVKLLKHFEYHKVPDNVIIVINVSAMAHC